VIRVFTISPGAIAPTLTRVEFHSRASARVNPITPALAAE
jgi:hypothetical protein